MDKKIIIALVVIVIVAIAGYFYWANLQKTALNQQTAQQQESVTLGGQIYQDVNSSVGDSLPETNPFNTQTNPFKDTYTNPFGQ